MSTTFTFPEQNRAKDAIKELDYYFEIEGNIGREPLPSMSKLVDYFNGSSRLLRVRDSPLRFLHDPNLPYIVVHDWYIGIALDYLDASFYFLFRQWENDYRKKRNNRQQITQLFSRLVNVIYKCYLDVSLVLTLPFPEGSALGSAELKEKVKVASIKLIKEKTLHTFNDARSTFYTVSFEQIESLFRAKHNLGDDSFAYLFSPNISKFKGPDLEAKIQMMIDTVLPHLIDIFNLSDRILESIALDHPSDSVNNNIAVDTWLLESDNGDEGSSNVERLESDIQNFKEVCDQLNTMELALDWKTNLKNIINSRLRVPKWTENFDISLVPIQLKWLHVLILPWISHILPNTENIDTNWNNFLREKIKAEYLLYDMIYKLRIDEIFSIICDYPSTKSAVNDLHIVVTKRGLLQDLKTKLTGELKVRLFHQGASATDILQQYIGCIHCLSIIDPTCDIMTHIIELFENYMRVYRNDIVKGVVELVRDYLDEEPNGTKEEYMYVFEQSEINQSDLPPDTIIVEEDRPAKLSDLQKKAKDPIAMLISICSSLNDFINGYSDKLGEILLTCTNYDIDAEVRRLELLKLHFPPDAFMRCDIMLKDMDDSRRLDRSIHERTGVDPILHSTIMSGKYWPGGQDESDDDDNMNETHLGEWMKDLISTKEYDSEFRQTKVNRKLSFLPTKGTVTIELEFKSKTLKLNVRPEALRILSLFESKEDSHTRQSIINIVKLDKITVAECLEFWMKEGVLQLTADGHYELVEE